MATHAETMLAKYEALLERNAGVASVNTDGTTVSFQDLEKRWQFWRKQVAREQGRARRYKSVDMSGPVATEEEEEA